MDGLFVYTVDKPDVRTSLAEIAQGRPVVIDMWKSMCPSCPAAIAKLATIARRHSDVVFVAANIDDMEHAVMMSESGDHLNSLVHTYMEYDTKETLKRHLSDFTRVPYCIMFNSRGQIVESGLAGLVDYGMIETLI